jgi:hypothetical protein
VLNRFSCRFAPSQPAVIKPHDQQVFGAGDFATNRFTPRSEPTCRKVFQDLNVLVSSQRNLMVDNTECMYRCADSLAVAAVWWQPVPSPYHAKVVVFMSGRVDSLRSHLRDSTDGPHPRSAAHQREGTLAHPTGQQPRNQSTAPEAEALSRCAGGRPAALRDFVPCSMCTIFASTPNTFACLRLVHQLVRQGRQDLLLRSDPNQSHRIAIRYVYIQFGACYG